MKRNQTEITYLLIHYSILLWLLTVSISANTDLCVKNNFKWKEMKTCTLVWIWASNLIHVAFFIVKVMRCKTNSRLSNKKWYHSSIAFYKLISNWAHSVAFLRLFLSRNICSAKLLCSLNFHREIDLTVNKIKMILHNTRNESCMK